MSTKIPNSLLSAPGRVIQVVDGTPSSTDFSFTSSTFFTVDAPLTITPRFANSKILIWTNFGVVRQLPAGGAGAIHWQVFRDAGATGVGKPMLWTEHQGANYWHMGQMGALVDYPGVIVPVTYDVYIRTNAGESMTWGGVTGVTFLTAMEVAA